jgi:hypothetical protein
MKDTLWLKHDINAFSDPKIQAMMCRYGVKGYGLFWLIVECLRNEPQCELMRTQCVWNAIAYRTHETASEIEEFVNACINDFQLFLADEKVFFSKRLKEDVFLKREKARNSANYRWVNATALRKNANAQKRICDFMRIDANKRREEKSREDKIREEKKREEHNTPLPPILQTEEFKSAWELWKKFRGEIKKPLVPTTIDQQLKKLEAMGPEKAVEALKQSMAAGWQGIFEPRQEIKPQNRFGPQKIDNDYLQKQAAIFLARHEGEGK